MILIQHPLFGRNQLIYQSSHSKQERAVETIELAGMILDENQKIFLTGCVIAISDNFIDREYTRKILEVLRMSKVLRALEEEAKDEGRVEGRVEEKKATARKLLLKGMSIDEIAEITGLLKDDIRLLH
jgi:predicted transposase/invertase (TIGR01784 family)